MELPVFRKKLIRWFRENSRPLPWRHSRGWYDIWISEVMLQQTQVAQVIPYYNRFIRQFPNVASLAAASLETVLKLWEGLGYYTRARQLHQAARLIVADYNSSLPDTPGELIRLPGFGTYTSSAVLSLAFNKPLRVVDGNVIRVITRLFAITQDIRDVTTRKIVADLADRMLDHRRPGVFNESLMELGALICTPRNPVCHACPVSEFCQARQQGLVGQLPFKSPAKPKPELTVKTFAAFYRKKYLLARRPVNGLLGGMWEFPCLLPDPDPKFSKKFPAGIELFGESVGTLASVRHSFTHFRLQLDPVLYRLDNTRVACSFYSEFRWLELDRIRELPLHRSMQKLLSLITGNSEIVSE